MLFDITIVAVAFAAALIFDRMSTSSMSLVDVRDDKVSLEIALRHYGWIKFPRTLFLFGACCCIGINLQEEIKLALFLAFAVFYLGMAVFDGLKAYKFIK